MEIGQKELEKLKKAGIGKSTDHVFVYRFPDSLDMPEMDVGGFLKEMDGEKGRERELALYLHIPFCTRICGYCHYYKEAFGQGKGIEGFLGAVEKEIGSYRSLLGENVRVCSVLFGGGTPTCLEAEQVNGLAGLLRNMFSVGKGVEATIESSPETLNLEKLSRLRQNFNRLSIGVQDFDDKVLRECNRNHSREQALKAVKEAREAGFENVNIDLIYGLPKQGIEGWKRTLDEIEGILPESVTASDLRVQKGSEFFSGNRKEFASEQELVKMHSMFVEKMLSLGFEQLFPYQFVKKGKSMKFLENQWKNSEFLGFGPSSCSYISGWDYNNLFPLDRYEKAVKEQGFAFAVGKKLGTDERIKRKVALGLKLCKEGIDKAGFEAEFEVSLGEVFGKIVEELEGLGLVENSVKRLRLSPKGILFYDSVSRKFF